MGPQQYNNQYQGSPQVIMPGQQPPMNGQMVGQPGMQAVPQTILPGQQMQQGFNNANMGAVAMAANQAVPPSSKKDIPSSTQSTILISELRDNVVIMRDGSFRAVVACKSINFDLMSEGEREGIVYYNDRYGGPTAEIMCTMFFERNGEDPVVLCATEVVVLRASDFDASVSAKGLASTYDIYTRNRQPEAWIYEDQMTIPVTIETTYDDVDTSVYYDWYVYGYSGLSELEDGVITVSNTTREGDTDRVEFYFDLEKLPLGRFAIYCCKR